MNSMKPLLVFDLNSTLVFSTHHPEPGMRSDVKLGAGKSVWERPGVRGFMKWVFERFDVAVWSSHMEHNALPIVEWLFTPEQRSRLLFVWCRTQCEKNEQGWGTTKPLAKVRKEFAHAQIYLIDDERTKCAAEDRINYIYVKPFIASFKHNKREVDPGLLELQAVLQNKLLIC